MSVLLTYYKCLDDWNDDHNLLAHGSSRALKKKADEAANRWPRQSLSITKGLAELNKMEHVNETNPDLPANCFGAIMGELFVREEDTYATQLRCMGTALGRFIYIMDAIEDLRSDIKKERYNPLIAQTDMDFIPMLSMLMGECTASFEMLPLTRDLTLLKNTLYAGVWMKFQRKEGSV